jgi:mycothiol synthase
MAGLQWGPLTEADLPALRRLARACLDRDGGLPLLDSDAFLRARMVLETSTGGRDELGELVAAAAVGHDSDGGMTGTGLVHPSFRQLGLGSQLVEWGDRQVGSAAVRVAVDAVSPTVVELLRDHGFVQVFSEVVMRHDLRDVPFCARPPGLVAFPFNDDTSTLFHAAYRRSFADRPGFQDPPRDEWVREAARDDDFRPDLSRVVLDPDGHPVGFIIVSDTWVDQVGVVPRGRGHGLGAHLVARTLSALERGGARESWLAVTTDNPTAQGLYGRLGYTVYGSRARFARPASDDSGGEEPAHHAR